MSDAAINGFLKAADATCTNGKLEVYANINKDFPKDYRCKVTTSPGEHEKKIVLRTHSKCLFIYLSVCVFMIYDSPLHNCLCTVVIKMH